MSGDHAAGGRGQCKNRCVGPEAIRLLLVYPCWHQLSGHATRLGEESIARANRRVGLGSQTADAKTNQNPFWEDDAVCSLTNRLVWGDTGGTRREETATSPRSCFRAACEVRETDEKEWWPWFPNVAS